MAATLRAQLSWSVFSRLVVTFLRLGTGIVLMYWVAPSLFGLVGMAAVAVAFLTMLRNWGLGPAAIHHQVKAAAEWQQLHGLSILLGIVVALLLLVSQPWVAAYFKVELPPSIFYAFAALILQESFLHIPQSALDAQGDFPLVGRLEIVGQVLAAAIAIGLALAGYPLAALLLRLLIGPLLLIAYLSRYLPWILRPKWISSDLALKYFPFCWPFFLDGNLSFAIRHIDDAVVGRLFGEAALGVYSRAYLLLLLPLLTVSIAIGRVYLPLLAASKTKAEQGRYFTAVLGLISSILFPPLLFIALNGSALIDWLFPSDWSSLGPLVQLFALLGILQCIAVLEGTVFQALGKTKEQLVYAVPGKLFTLATILIAAFYARDSFGVALGFALGNGLYRIVITYQMCRWLGVTASRFIQSLLPATVAAGLAWLLYHLTFFNQSHYLWRLLVGGLVYLLAYVLAYAKLFPRQFKQCIKI